MGKYKFISENWEMLSLKIIEFVERIVKPNSFNFLNKATMKLDKCALQRPIVAQDGITKGF